MFELHLTPQEGSAPPDRIEAICSIPSAESSWFSGHFPANPIFPALGLLGFVNKMLHMIAPSGEDPLLPLQYRRVRFRRIIRPGEELSASLEADDPTAHGRYRFKITKDADLVSDGTVIRGQMPRDFVRKEPESFRVAVKADIPIKDLIPHGEGMRIVERYDGCDETGTGITRTVVRDAWPLCEGNRVHPNVMIELVAQATAAMVGWAELKEGHKGGHGYVVGMKQAWVDGNPLRVGMALIMKTREVLAQGNYGVFSGSVSSEDGVVCELMLQVFRP